MGPCLLAALLLAPAASGQNAAPQSANRPERVEWFRDQGFGMFIHWSVDGQLGGVISHSMAGASDDYFNRFLTILPKTFYPERFDARKWARLAKIAGVKYVMFTTKHHSGFAMFDTRTTDFGVMDTPFRRDITAEVVDAFREQGIAIGLYFSCDDFSWLYRHGKPIDREDRSQPFNNPELLRFAQAQLQELLTQYGKVDLMFFDGKAQGLVDYVWARSPDTVITSGALHVTEQNVPGFAMKEPFETAATLGTEWPYRPADTYKSGLAMVNLLIETRAKGGDLLLNMGPKPDGDIPIEQDDRFRQIGYWMFINGEAIYGVRPWVITNEGDYWFTRKAGEDTVYVFARSAWPYAAWRDIRLVSVRTTARVQGQRARSERRNSGISGRRASGDNLEAGGRRPAHSRHARAADVYQQSGPESGGPQDHPRRRRTRCRGPAAGEYGESPLGRCHRHGHARGQFAIDGKVHRTGRVVRIPQHQRARRQ